MSSALNVKSALPAKCSVSEPASIRAGWVRLLTWQRWGWLTAHGGVTLAELACGNLREYDADADRRLGVLVVGPRGRYIRAGGQRPQLGALFLGQRPVQREELAGPSPPPQDYRTGTPPGAPPPPQPGVAGPEGSRTRG